VHVVCAVDFYFAASTGRGLHPLLLLPLLLPLRLLPPLLLPQLTALARHGGGVPAGWAG
jgi:hypothetical protein